MDEYIDVKIVVFQHGEQRVSLRRSLTVRTLIEEILKEFHDIGPDSPEKYEICSKGAPPFAVNATLADSNIRPQDELIIQYIRQNGRQMLDENQFAFLRDESGFKYLIQWQPAVIGRPDSNDAEHNMNLAVNLKDHPKKQAISRKHAQITFSDGRYYLESLAESNPITVRGKQIPFGTQQELINEDMISIGTMGLQMTFITKAGALVIPKTDSPVLDPTIPLTPSLKEPVSHLPSPQVNQNKAPLASESFQAASLIIEVATDQTRIGQRLELTSYPSVIGRELVLLNTEKDVSRRHAEVNYDLVTQKFYITDLKSTNGVFVNSVRIKPNDAQEIESGTRIGLGANLVLRFQL